MAAEDPRPGESRTRRIERILQEEIDQRTRGPPPPRLLSDRVVREVLSSSGELRAEAGGGGPPALVRRLLRTAASLVMALVDALPAAGGKLPLVRQQALQLRGFLEPTPLHTQDQELSSTVSVSVPSEPPLGAAADRQQLFDLVLHPRIPHPPTEFRRR